MASGEREVIIIGYSMPSGADTFKVPPVDGYEAVSFLRCDFGISVIYERIQDGSQGNQEQG
jgi:hypothetical protein